MANHLKGFGTIQCLAGLPLSQKGSTSRYLPMIGRQRPHL